MSVAQLPIDLSLTAQAFDQIYARPLTVIASSELVEGLIPLLKDVAAIISVDSDGGHWGFDETNQVGDKSDIPVSAVPSGVMAFVFLAEHKPVLEAWLDLYRKAGAQSQPKHLLLDEHRQDRIAPFLSQVFASRVKQLMHQSAEQEQQIVTLRQNLEERRLDQSRMRRHLERLKEQVNLAAALELGQEYIGPKADVDANRLCQPLPVTLSRLHAIKLYAAGMGSQGRLSIQLRQSGTKQVLFETQLAASSIKKGWFSIRTNRILPKTEGELVLHWHEGCDVHLGLSSMRGDRFSESDDGRVLAMQLFKNVSPLDSQIDEIGPFQSSDRPMSDYSDKMEFLGGEMALKSTQGLLAGGPIKKSKEWIQTHPLPKNKDNIVSAVLFKGAVPANTGKVDLTVGLAHANASPVVARALVCSSDTIKDQTDLEKYLQDNKDVGVASVTLKGGEMTVLQLDCKAFQSDRDLVLMAEPEGEHVRFGRCRWYSIQVEFSDNATYQCGAAEIEEETSGRFETRPVSTRELVGALSYINGAARLQSLKEALGFQPLLFNSAGDYVQLHPMKEHMSAAIMQDYIRPDQASVGFTVYTAHEKAPDFLYGLAAVDRNDPAWRHKFDDFYDQISVDMPAAGQSECGALTWQTIALSGGQDARLSLSLAGQDTVRHLILFTKPVGKTTAYGWCRWQDMAIYYEGDRFGEG